jgi:hypothetical protein
MSLTPGNRIYLVLCRASYNLHLRRDPNLCHPPEVWFQVAETNDAWKSRDHGLLSRVHMILYLTRTAKLLVRNKITILRICVYQLSISSSER